MRAVIQRINRKLSSDKELLKTSCSEGMRLDVGQYYIFDFELNAVVQHDVDPQTLAIGI
jgi:hypothetical protein